MCNEHKILLDKFQTLQDDKQLFKNIESETSDEFRMRMDIDIERMMKRLHKEDKKLSSTYRFLRYGQKKKIIEMKFGELGSLKETGIKNCEISKRLFIKRNTVWSVINAYKQRNGELLVDRFEKNKNGRKKILNEHQ